MFVEEKGGVVPQCEREKICAVVAVQMAISMPIFVVLELLLLALLLHHANKHGCGLLMCVRHGWVCGRSGGRSAVMWVQSNHPTEGNSLGDVGQVFLSPSGESALLNIDHSRQAAEVTRSIPNPLRYPGLSYDCKDWINLVQDRDLWQAYVRAAMNLRVPYKPECRSSERSGLQRRGRGDKRRPNPFRFLKGFVLFVVEELRYSGSEGDTLERASVL
ncbi:hypothetical protein ANN_15353 [Periplaneta americana]|uniref:Uncharacterized protein n=1 Tax=Periplaneta americana TaxID=6978 RepID=A0ABQ8SH03_PERAM|nr:hypothetical protein ANN_15353 [Periplaneta americana]